MFLRISDCIDRLLGNSREQKVSFPITQLLDTAKQADKRIKNNSVYVTLDYILIDCKILHLAIEGFEHVFNERS